MSSHSTINTNTNTSTTTMPASSDCPTCFSPYKRLILNVRPRPKLTIKLSPRKKICGNGVHTSLSKEHLLGERPFITIELSPRKKAKQCSIKLSPRKERVAVKLRFRKVKRPQIKQEVIGERKKLVIKLSPRKEVDEVRVKQEI